MLIFGILNMVLLTIVMGIVIGIWRTTHFFEIKPICFVLLVLVVWASFNTAFIINQQNQLTKLEERLCKLEK